MLIRDPLVHFLAAGAILFAVFMWLGTEDSPEQIVVTADQVAALGRSASLLEGRALTNEELRRQLEPLIREEVYYREALRLGLDVDDDEVRRRLVEKMQYLSENLADPEPPSQQAIADYYAADPERFAIPETATFDQVFFSPGQRGESIDADVAAALTALADGADPQTQGDRTPLESRLVAAPRERVRVLFGEAMTSAVFDAQLNTWHGPYVSDFGLHLIRVVERSPSRVPAFDEIAEQVREVYAEDRRRAANEAAYAEMLARYDVVIEWPAGPGSGESGAGDETRAGGESSARGESGAGSSTP